MSFAAPTSCAADLPGRHIALADGRRALGTVIEYAGERRAYDAQDRRAGVFNTHADARLALIARAVT